MEFNEKLVVEQIKTNVSIVNILIQFVENDFKEFSEKIVCSNYQLLGVRSSIVKQIAKIMVKNDVWQSFVNQKHCYYEEFLLTSYITGFVKVEKEQLVNLINNYLPFVDCWALCDSLCAGLKQIKKDKEYFFNYLKQFQTSEKTYYVRFMFVCFLDYFLDDEHIEEVLKICCDFNSTEYYINMAIAWLVSVALVKQFDKTIKVIKLNKLPTWVHNKAIQKACESFRISKDIKEYLKTLKIK